MTRHSSYFITGGAGFIGHHLTKALLASGASQVVSYDAQKHYIPLDKSLWPFYQAYRIELLQDERLTRVRGDTTDRGWLKEMLETHMPDVIIHLAALPIASVSNKYPEEARRNILDGTITVLDVLREATFEFSRFVYISSSMVYGDFYRDDRGDIVPASEDQPCLPIGLYGAMKLSGEYITKAYSSRFGLPYTIIRPSAVYGPTDCNRRVTEIFLHRALSGERLRLDNGGEHKVDFTYVDDLANGLVLASNSPEAVNETFNMTRGEGRSIRELAEVISSFVPRVEMYEKFLPVNRPNRGSLDISKARDLLGYNPVHSLEDGMEKYVEFVKEMET